MVFGIIDKYLEGREEQCLYKFVTSLALQKLLLHILIQSPPGIIINFVFSYDTFLINLNYITEEQISKI